jgi:hypothetical protein
MGAKNAPHHLLPSDASDEECRKSDLKERAKDR